MKERLLLECLQMLPEVIVIPDGEGYVTIAPETLQIYLYSFILPTLTFAGIVILEVSDLGT